ADGFRNPQLAQRERSFLAYWRMRWFGDEPFAEYAGQEHKVPRVAPDLGLIARPGSAPQVTWIGHATLLLQHRGRNLLTDPIFSQRAGPTAFLGARRHTPPALTLDQLPPIDYVLISHDHYDHLDRASVQALGDRPLWLVPLGLKAWLVEAGIDPARVVERDWWQAWQDGPVRFTATPLQHWSGRGLFDRFDTLWCGWAVDLDGFRLWFGGDTGYNPVQFRDTGARLGPFDLALLPIGAYAPRWFMRDMHVDPEEALTLHRELRATRSLGIHWGTFRLSAEPIDAPPQRLRAAVAAAGLPATALGTLARGQTLRLEADFAARRAP
ncbi:MAG TPA: MBL fold metallo-hydrolase, partial [Gammaproteobacteria bacterium]